MAGVVLLVGKRLTLLLRLARAIMLVAKNLSPLSVLLAPPPPDNVVGTGVRVTEAADTEAAAVVVTMQLLLEFKLARSGLNFGGSSLAS